MNIIRSLITRLTRRPVASPNGTPIRAIIAPAACGGFLLFIDYAHRQIAADVDLGTRWDAYDTPDDREFTVADRGLTGMGLARTGPWRADGYPGRFTAPITHLDRERTGRA